MGNSNGANAPGGKIANAQGGNKLINNDIDYYNLLLVEKGIRPAYLWYPHGDKERHNPPNCSDKLERILLKFIAKSNSKSTDGFDRYYYYILKTNMDVKSKLEKLKTNYSQELEGEILGYLYPQRLISDDEFYYWFTICIVPPPNLKAVKLWSESIPLDGDLNKTGQLLQKVHNVIPSAFSQIVYKKKQFGNAY